MNDAGSSSQPSDAPGSLGAWLASRTPPPPDALVARLRAMLGDETLRPAGEAPDACLRAAERELTRLLGGDERSRDCAVDLLAVDALVTYAFEAACADDPARVAARADAAMAALSRLDTTTRDP